MVFIGTYFHKMQISVLEVKVNGMFVLFKNKGSAEKFIYSFFPSPMDHVREGYVMG